MDNNSVLQGLKLHIIEVLYLKVLNQTFSNGIEFIIKVIMTNDESMSKNLLYYKVIAKIINSSINSYFSIKYSADFGEICLNFIKLTKDIVPLSNSSILKKLAYLFLRYFLEPFAELFIIKFLSTSKSISKINMILPTIKSILELISLSGNITILNSFSISDFIFGVTVANRGESQTTGFFSRSVNVVLFYLLVRLGMWFYSKSSAERSVSHIDEPRNCSLLKRITSNTVPPVQIQSCFTCKIKLESNYIICRFCSLKYC